jgi:hypothetical protein
MPQNLTTWDLPALLHIREKGVLRIFIALKKSVALARFEPATFGPCDDQGDPNLVTIRYHFLILFDVKLQELT